MRPQMADQDERRRILDMLASGQINADEAEELLGALAGDRVDPHGIRRAVDSAVADAMGAADHAMRHVTGGRQNRPRRISRSLRITIDSGDEEQGNRGRVAVTVPVALAKFAGKLIPEEIRVKLESEGIELADLLEALDQDLPEGRLVDIDTNSAEGGKRARIIVEVA